MPLSPDEQKTFNAAFAAAIADDHVAVTAEAAPIEDIRAFFCENFGTIDMVLKALPGLMPNAAAKLAVTLAITAVESLHTTICK